MTGIRPVNRIKHVVDSEGVLTGAASSTTDIANAVVTRNAVFNPVEVEVGEQINGVFVSIFNIGASGVGANGSINWYVGKRRGGQSLSDFPAAGQTGVSNVRNQIFHEEKGLAGSQDGTPMAFKGVIVIPKGMRRMREGDVIFFRFRSTDATNDVNFCLKSIYNSYS